MKKTDATEGHLPICADEAYTVEQFGRRAGLSRPAIRSAEREGLRSCFVGRRKYIRGAEWLRFLKQEEKEQQEEMREALDEPEGEADDDDRMPGL